MAGQPPAEAGGVGGRHHPTPGRAGLLGGRAERGAHRGGDLPRVPPAAAGGQRPRLRGGRRALGRRGALRDRGDHQAGIDARGVAGAALPAVLPGDAKTGVKDPVIRHHDGGWHLWTSCHPLADPGETDQMTTEYATSADGLDWIWHGTALSGRSGRWDARGTRVSAVCYADDAAGATIAAFYDGRASAAENFEERTGIATGTEPAALAATGTAAAAESPYAGRGLRYLDVLPLGEGRHRLYYEVTRP